MSGDWETRSSGGTIKKLGDKEGQVREVMGVYVGSRMGDFGKPLHDFLGEGGEAFTVPDNKALEKNLDESDVGRLVQITFDGWGKTRAGGTFKYLTVQSLKSCGDSEWAGFTKRFPALREEVSLQKYGKAQAVVEAVVEGDPELPF